MKIAATLAIAAAACALASPASAQFAKPEDAVKYRQSGMFLMAQHFGRVGAMANGRAPWDANAVRSNAELVATLAPLPFAGFVEGTASTTKGGAKATIWSNKAGFDAASKKLQDEVAKFVTAARSGDQAAVRTAAGAVGGACKGCHDDYRNN